MKINGVDKGKMLVELMDDTYTYHYPELSKAVFLSERELKYADVLLGNIQKDYFFTRDICEELSDRSFEKLIIFLKKKGIITSVFARFCKEDKQFIQTLPKDLYIQIRIAAAAKKEDKKKYVMSEQKKICNKCVHRDLCPGDTEVYEDFEAYLNQFQEVYVIVK